MSDFTFDGTIKRVIDGDTVDAQLDLGFHVHHNPRLRVKDVDTNEIYGVSKTSEEYQLGYEQKLFVEEWFRTANNHDGEWPLTVTTETASPGIYGRWTATITRTIDGRSLTDDLIAEYPSVESRQ